MTRHDVIILGAGPAGLSAAAELHRLGIDDVVIVDREHTAGGIPRHCGHGGYGLLQFGRWMSGPEFAKQLVDNINVDQLKLGHTALKLEANGSVQITGPAGAHTLHGRKVLLAMGARETPRSARLVSGTRPWGVMTTGALQQFVYLHGKTPCQRPLVIGSELVSFSTLLTLRHVGIKPVAMIEEHSRISAWRPAEWIARLGFGVPVLTDCSDLRILGIDRVEALAFHHRGKRKQLECDGIIFTGRIRPESALLTQSHLQIDPHTQGPITDALFRCSDPAYFACGNLRTGVKTAGQCWREGKTAARAIHAKLKAEHV